MSLARLVVTAVRIEGRTKAEVSRDYGVSTRWVYELCRRFDAEGDVGLEPRSRRPRASPQRTSGAVEDEIVALRKELADQGLDAGAHTIAYHLISRHGRAPSVATIWRVLSRRGFVTPQPQKRPKSSFVRFCAEMPNERWQGDITHWALQGGTEVEILNVIDDHSRFLVSSVGTDVFKGGDVVAVFLQAAGVHGLPASVLTDNASVFTGVPRGGRCAMETELGSLGVRYVHSSPYHPQTCGKVERFHQTLKRWLAKQPGARTVSELQDQLERFGAYYNGTRPHRALGRRTPVEAFEGRPKATPALPGFEISSHYRVRKDRIDSCGKLTIRHNSRLHHIGLGRRFKGTRVLVLVRDLYVRVITEQGELLRELTLDPSRNYQPQERSA